MFILDLSVGGHPLCAVVADHEPERERRKALTALEAALPPPEAFAAAGCRFAGLATTPDFHYGKPVPVGVVARVEGAVLPHLVGNDIGCGMRLSVLRGVRADDVRAADRLEHHLRHLLFQGGRDIAMSGRARAAALSQGLLGFVEALRREKRIGLLARLDLDVCEAELDRVESYGSLPAVGLDPDFADFCEGDAPRRDAILASLGGGNHFLEIGVVETVVDGAFAYAAGLRAGDVTLCVHSGSLDFGHRVNATVADALRADGAGRILTLGTAVAERYRTGLCNAANAAFLNRFLLAEVAAEALRRSGLDARRPVLVYDAPHNLAWFEDGAVLHRKGACPARSGAAMVGTPYDGLGEPVILPGSMGDATWLLAGEGAAVTHASSAHGAGRKLSRGQARHRAADLGSLRLVGPMDLDARELRGRPDILAKARLRLAEEAPAAYRPVEDVVAPMVAAGLVRPVARIRPLLTAKG